MTDEQILDVIKSVCGFDSAGVERWRAEALIIGRAVEKASRRAALEDAAVACEDVAKARNVVEMAIGASLCVDAIRALADGG